MFWEICQLIRRCPKFTQRANTLTLFAISVAFLVS
jgi:hypothetical protein